MLQTTTTQIKLDTLRVDQFVLEAQKRATEVNEFTVAKIAKLKAAEDQLEQFLQATKCTDLVIGNIYSTGVEQLGGTYNNTCKMIAHCTITSKKEYNNLKLAANRLQEKWDIIVIDINATFKGYQIKGTEIKFQIWF